MRMDQGKYGGPSDGASARVAGVLYLDGAPRDFDLEVAFSLSVLRFQIPGLSDRQGGRETSVSRPYVTDPFLTCWSAPNNINISN